MTLSEPDLQGHDHRLTSLLSNFARAKGRSFNSGKSYNSDVSPWPWPWRSSSLKVLVNMSNV